MTKKKPISFEEAVNLASEKQMAAFNAGQIGPNPGQYFWYTNNFIQFISELGHHIEITGDEFEAAVLSDKVI